MVHCFSTIRIEYIRYMAHTNPLPRCI